MHQRHITSWANIFAVHLQRADQYASVPRSSDCKQQQNNCTSVVLIGQPCEFLLSFQRKWMHISTFSCQLPSSFGVTFSTSVVKEFRVASPFLLQMLCSAIVLRVKPQCTTHVQYNYCLRMHLSRIYVPSFTCLACQYCLWLAQVYIACSCDVFRTLSNFLYLLITVTLGKHQRLAPKVKTQRYLR